MGMVRAVFVTRRRPSGEGAGADPIQRSDKGGLCFGTKLPVAIERGWGQRRERWHVEALGRKAHKRRRLAADDCRIAYSIH